MYFIVFNGLKGFKFYIIQHGQIHVVVCKGTDLLALQIDICFTHRLFVVVMHTCIKH